MNERNLKNLCGTEEKILIQSHSSSADLKKKIRKTMDKYVEMQWKLDNISSDESFIYLKFKPICK